jgi:hypothetical protein
VLGPDACGGFLRREAGGHPPCIDAFAPKNQPLDGERVAAILEAAGMVDAGGTGGGDPAFHRLDGSLARVGRRAELSQEHTLTPRRRSCSRCPAGTG